MTFTLRVGRHAGEYDIIEDGAMTYTPAVCFHRGDLQSTVEVLRYLRTTYPGAVIRTSSGLVLIPLGTES